MEELTEKQKANRDYYAENKEKIAARRRKAYKKKKEAANGEKNPFNTMPPKPKAKAEAVRKKIVTKTGYGRPSQEELKAGRVRRKIEDWHLAKELGINAF